jgi:hypothetical protein
MKDNVIILRTILEYYLDRQREFYRLKNELKTCCCFPTRKKIKERLEELNFIINKDNTLSKHAPKAKLGLDYKDMKDFPELIEIQNKTRELKRLITC